MYKESKFLKVDKISTLAVFQFLEINNDSEALGKVDTVGGSRQQRQIIMAKLVISWLRVAKKRA